MKPTKDVTLRMIKNHLYTQATNYWLSMPPIYQWLYNVQLISMRLLNMLPAIWNHRKGLLSTEQTPNNKDYSQKDCVQRATKLWTKDTFFNNNIMNSWNSHVRLNQIYQHLKHLMPTYVTTKKISINFRKILYKKNKKKFKKWLKTTWKKKKNSYK